MPSKMTGSRSLLEQLREPATVSTPDAIVIFYTVIFFLLAVIGSLLAMHTIGRAAYRGSFPCSRSGAFSFLDWESPPEFL
jgi:hypothetical protein